MSISRMIYNIILLILFLIVCYQGYISIPKLTVIRAKNKLIKDTVKTRNYKRVKKNFTIYGNDNHFSIRQIHISNLVSLELISANFPRGQYLIDDGNRWIDVTIDGVDYSASLDIGNGSTSVSISEFLSESFNSKLQFSYIPSTSKFKVMSTYKFSLNFKSGVHCSDSMCREIGFDNLKDYSSNESNCLDSPYRADMSGARFIHLTSPELDGKLDRGLLAQVPLLPPCPYASYNPGQVNRRYFEPFPLRCLTINISEYDTTKRLLRPYRFNGLFWGLVLEATVLEQVFPDQPHPMKVSTMINSVYWVTSGSNTGAAIVI